MNKIIKKDLFLLLSDGLEKWRGRGGEAFKFHVNVNFLI